jgi:hypothetical protein
MTSQNRSNSPRRRRAGRNAGEARALLAAVSLLATSLGVVTAAPTNAAALPNRALPSHDGTAVDPTAVDPAQPKERADDQKLQTKLAKVYKVNSGKVRQYKEPKGSTEVVKYREGGDPSSSRKSPGRNKWNLAKHWRIPSVK